jgi:hypothetical protein
MVRNVLLGQLVQLVLTIRMEQLQQLKKLELKLLRIEQHQ